MSKTIKKETENNWVTWHLFWGAKQTHHWQNLLSTFFGQFLLAANCRSFFLRCLKEKFFRVVFWVNHVNSDELRINVPHTFLFHDHATGLGGVFSSPIGIEKKTNTSKWVHGILPDNRQPGERNLKKNHQTKSSWWF